MHYFCLAFCKNVIENVLNYLCFNSSFNWLFEDARSVQELITVLFSFFVEKHLFLLF